VDPGRKDNLIKPSGELFESIEMRQVGGPASVQLREKKWRRPGIIGGEEGRDGRTPAAKTKGSKKILLGRREEESSCKQRRKGDAV